MKLSPYSHVGNVTFGIGPDALVQVAGQPHSQRSNRASETELDYGSIVYRFDSNSTLVEITADSPALELDGYLIPFPLLAGYVREHDQSAFERVGFLVSPRFGIAHDPDCPSWVTAFPEESLDRWRAIGSSSAGA